jgi:hypothetical protein
MTFNLINMKIDKDQQWLHEAAKKLAGDVLRNKQSAMPDHEFIQLQIRHILKSAWLRGFSYGIDDRTIVRGEKLVDRQTGEVLD